LCLYSDGIIEQCDLAEDEQFGVERLRQSLSTRNGMAAEQVVGAVVDDLASWAGSEAFIDDVSLVVIEWRGR